MTRGVSTTLPTALPARFERLFAWQLDRRCKAVREVAADLFELWQDLGGVDSLSAQRRWMCRADTASDQENGRFSARCSTGSACRAA